MALVVGHIYAPAVVLPDLLGKEIKKALATVKKKTESNDNAVIWYLSLMCNLTSIGL